MHSNDHIEYIYSNIIQWNAFVKLLPLWLAPNLVTLLGFFCILINIVFVVIFVPDLIGPVSLTPVFEGGETCS